jgi:hypothetical protein
MKPRAFVLPVSRSIPLIVACLMLAFPIAGHAQPDPAIGTWKLIPEKSKYTPGPPPSNIVVKIEAAGQDGLEVTASSTAANGKVVTTHYTARADGKEYPVTGQPDYDAVSFKQLAPGSVMGMRKRSGNLVQTYTRVVSKDRRTMTVTTTGVDAANRPINYVAVFNRQR